MNGRRARWLFVAASLLAFAVLAGLARGNSILHGDVRLARWIQQWRWPSLDTLTDAANWSMRTGPLAIGVLIILIGLLWRHWWAEAALLATATLIMHGSYVMKELFDSPRPPASLVRVAEQSDTFGFPAGRAGNAVLVLGALAWIAGRHVTSSRIRIGIWIAAGFWILLTGVARIRVGAHWPSDILGAWLWTIPVLIILTALTASRQNCDDRG